jgi:hypothetical protein
MRWTAWCALLPAALLAQTQNPEAGRIEIFGLQATLTVDTPRPLDSVAQTLAERYRLLVNVEDPEYLFEGDRRDVTAEVARTRPAPGRRVLVPRGGSLKVTFEVKEDGSPRAPGSLLQSAVDAANAQFPFSYRVEQAGGFILIPTKTRDADGQVVDQPALLDRKITIAPSVARVLEHGQALADALSAQTGFHVSCCQASVGGVPWGMQTVAFEAHEETARSVLIRLMQAAGGGTHYLQRCDPVRPGQQTWCFINVAGTPLQAPN